MLFLPQGSKSIKKDTIDLGRIEMKQLFFIVLQLLFISNSNANEFDNELDDSLIITTTGADKDLSFGWRKIAIETELGDLITINSSFDTGQITEFSIRGKREACIDLKLLENIAYPDFRTLKDIWYDHELNKINLIKFEFSYLNIGKNSVKGRYMAYVYIGSNDTADVVIKEFNVKRKSWDVIDMVVQ